ncbi:MAG: thiamine pyrophosphate-dependent enzyme, partial [Candidatus Omnitrophota bacterium]
MANLKEISKRREILTGGHRLCAGCAAGTIMRQVTHATELPLVVSFATGCVEVSTVLSPYTAWQCSFIHNAFENSAATMSGVETAYRALKKRGKLKDEFRFIAFGGDGGSYDIGLQSLSGAMERGHRMLYICYDNEAYMNCLSTSSSIMTNEGLKSISEVKVSDMVYAFDQKTHQLVLKECTGVFDNGKKEVFEVQSLHRNIKATGNHPFLILKRNGRGKENELIWKRVEELKVGDQVVVLKSLN